MKNKELKRWIADIKLVTVTWVHFPYLLPIILHHPRSFRLGQSTIMSVCLLLVLRKVSGRGPNYQTGKEAFNTLQIMLPWQLSGCLPLSSVSEIEHGLECLGTCLNCRFMFSRSGWGVRVSMRDKLAGAILLGLKMAS